MLVGFLGGASWLTPVLAQQAITSAVPAQVVFIPDSGATALSKHPSLPILYACTTGDPNASGLVTYRLNPDGSLADGGKKTYGQELFVVGTNTVFESVSLPPCVMAENKMLLLASAPAHAGDYFADSNKNQYAVLKLDEEGQPTKLVTAFRINLTPQQPLMATLWEPTTRRVYATYHAGVALWFELGRDGCPLDKQGHALAIPPILHYWSLAYVPQWQRFFAMQTGVGGRISIFRLTADGKGLDSFQSLHAVRGYYPSGSITASPKFRKLYLLDNGPSDELIVYPLTNEGRLTGVPRYFSLGQAVFIRFDFKGGLLYAFGKDGLLRIFELDDNGHPTGAPQVFDLACGDIRDFLVDEHTGKVYIASTQSHRRDAAQRRRRADQTAQAH